MHKGLVALGAVVFVSGMPSAHAQGYQRLPTIADCPAGYTLGVEDTDTPQLAVTNNPTPRTNTLPKAPSQQDNTGDPSNDIAAVPRQFMTGCIPPKTH